MGVGLGHRRRIAPVEVDEHGAMARARRGEQGPRRAVADAGHRWPAGLPSRGPLAERARLGVSMRHGRVERRVERKRECEVLLAVRGEREQLAWQEYG